MRSPRAKKRTGKRSPREESPRDDKPGPHVMHKQQSTREDTRELRVRIPLSIFAIFEQLCGTEKVTLALGTTSALKLAIAASPHVMLKLP